MAIAFARLEFVQRSSGKNSCAKSAYNSRSAVYFEGTEFQEAKNYNWSHKESVAYHTILLPENADEKFKNTEVLWNAVEKKENRKNSQTALEFVLALPDDEVISLEDKKNLTNSFIQKHFVDKGLIAQIDIHAPDKKAVLNPEIGELEDFNHNWHAHALITTRRLKENGQEFNDHKARDLMPEVRNGSVIAGEKWGKIWAEHQNQYFEEKGIDLRVDPTGIVPQKHLGPVRMRNVRFAYLDEIDSRIELNQLESMDVQKILNKITETKSVFTAQDVERFLLKHIAAENIPQIREEVWRQDSIVQLLDPKTEEALNKFSTKAIVEEEHKIMRLAEFLHARTALNINQDKSFHQFANNLSSEQKIAFKNILNGKGLSCIEGYAGTGKSYLLSALRQSYESEGIIVRAFGPDHATVNVLKEKGFAHSETLHRFLFLLHHDKKEIQKNKEVWIVDEAGKLGNRPLLEFLKAAKQYKVQVVFAGDSAQMASVDRGGAFQVFSRKFGAEFLTDIQRQQNENDRMAAKQLAIGKMGHAIDLLVKNGSIKWVTNKDEIKEELIKKWALDREAFPNQSSLIIAHSNKEIRELNELVRMYRRQKGELGEKEYLCESQHGKILVSTGDKIEFRAKDTSLGVTNGMTGTLTEASTHQFSVLLDDKYGARKVSFNPSQYSSFQLAYASTNFRSQGNTLDRVYVAHSTMMEKAGFYVALTRHVKKAYLFVSQSDTSCLSQLKRQAYRQTPNETTLDFITNEHLFQQKELLFRQEHLQDLKNSPSILSKVKGYTLSTWDDLRSRFNHLSQNSSDLKANQSFFTPEIQNQNLNKPVLEFQLHDWLGRKSDLKPEQTKIIQTLIRNEECSSILSKDDDHREANQRKTARHLLSEKGQQILNAYYESQNEVSLWRAAAQTDSSEQAKWKMACGERNGLAYQVTQAIPKEHLSKIFNRSSLAILHEQSSKHATFLNKHENIREDLDIKLKENIEQLAYKLFPEGPTKKNSKELRFGTKGSLCVTCKGEKTGSFYDHESKEGGGPLQLIQYRLKCSVKEAKTWAQEFLGEAKKDLVLPSQFSFKKAIQDPDIRWVSHKADPNVPAPSLEQLAPKFSQVYREAARHAYKDAEGHLLFYILRLVHKDDSSKKTIRPLSYGTYETDEQKPHWAFKGYQIEKRPLYQIEQLSQRPDAKVLIVEGEKTADAAAKLFAKDNIVCVTWAGGASAVAKTDWFPLYNKEVIIWPDNDEAGFKAADEICSELRKVGVKSLGVVNKDILQREFPSKWDLADPQPKNQPADLMKNLIQTTQNKAVSLDFLVSELKLKNLIEEKDWLLAKLQAKEILWRVEERMRPDLEKQYGGKSWEINQKILKETISIFNSKETIEKSLQQDLGIIGEINQKIAYQVLLQKALTGQEPSTSKIGEMKQAMANIFSLPSYEKTKKDWQSFTESKAWSSIFEKHLYFKDMPKNLTSLLQKEYMDVNKQLTQMIKREEQAIQLFTQQKDRERDVFYNHQ